MYVKTSIIRIYSSANSQDGGLCLVRGVAVTLWDTQRGLGYILKLVLSNLPV